jgi:hypothetical protein
MSGRIPPEGIEARRRALAMIGAISRGEPVWKYMADDLKDYKTGGDGSGIPVTFEAYRQEGLKAQSAALIAFWAMQKVELATGQSIPDQIREYGDWLNQQELP